MKNIHFDNLYAKWYNIPVLVISASLLTYVILTSGQGQYASEFLLASLLLSLILLVRKIWFKTYVQYTTSRISIRINSTSQLHIKFDDLTQIENREAKLILTENAKTHSINVEDVDPKDVQKLINLMVERSEAFYTDLSHLNYYE